VATDSEDFMILACVCLTQYHNVTDGQTNAQTMAKTHEALRALARNTCKSQPHKNCMPFFV